MKHVTAENAKSAEYYLSFLRALYDLRGSSILCRKLKS